MLLLLPCLGAMALLLSLLCLSCRVCLQAGLVTLLLLYIAYQLLTWLLAVFTRLPLCYLLLLTAASCLQEVVVVASICCSRGACVSLLRLSSWCAADSVC